ncbi:hypothetical protein SESBI_10782 [Sesbania bispinosa]|nr:hypothetical protein SESBI_10782 [Sesbania bispinosa]
MPYLRVNRDHPWCCIGDFNEVLNSHEKESILPATESRMELFRDFLGLTCTYGHGIRGLQIHVGWSNYQKLYNQGKAGQDAGKMGMEILIPTCIDHEECKGVVQSSWSGEADQMDPWENLSKKSKACKRKLSAWSSKTFKKPEKEIFELNKELRLLHNE